jgi:intermediate peptidase
MLKIARSRPWTCASCLRARAQARSASTIAAAKTDFAPAAFDTRNTSHDDKALRQVFDSRPFWYDFSKHARQPAAASVGLIRNRHLTTPEGFMVYAAESMRKCSALVAKILAVNTVEGYKGVVQDMDRLSDLMCRVIDLSDFVRSTHPNGRYQAAATNAYSAMYEYMNQLNTTTGLNDQLQRAAAIPEVYDSWTEEERRVANILIKDFSKSAIDLTDDDRRQFVEISNDIAKIGQGFVDYMAPRRTHVRFATGRLKGVPRGTINSLSRFGMATIPATGHEAVTTLSHADDAEVRREVFIANRTASRASIGRLEDMLMSRSRLAKLTGYESYSHMALSDKMAKTPDAVGRFLSALQNDTQPLVQAELRELQKLKRAHISGDDASSRVNAWDREYYAHRLTQQAQEGLRSADSLSSFFSLGTVFQGLSRIFNSLCGIRLVPHEALPGETWHDDVRRLDVIDEGGRNIAVVYCDLFARSGKHANPCHFTLRCSREILPEELAEAAANTGPYADATSAATDGSAYAVDPLTSTVHQLPTIALICSFAHPSGAATPALLSLRQVQTLFHEMGHALHSILGRTRLQNVAGTRCPTDLAELPSVLMEHFALAPETLRLWARHWATDAPLPEGAVAARLRARGRLRGLDVEAQVMMSRLDQALHSRPPGGGGGGSPVDSTAVYHAVAARTSLPDPRETAWQGFFGHLFCYGGAYYSYLFARALAGRVWHSVFADGALACDRRAGERLEGELLRWGGGRDAWRCVAGLLREEALAEGGEEAMAVVGRWGVRGRGDHDPI